MPIETTIDKKAAAVKAGTGVSVTKVTAKVFDLTLDTGEVSRFHVAQDRDYTLAEINALHDQVTSSVVTPRAKPITEELDDIKTRLIALEGRP